MEKLLNLTLNIDSELQKEFILHNPTIEEINDQWLHVVYSKLFDLSIYYSNKGDIRLRYKSRLYEDCRNEFMTYDDNLDNIVSYIVKCVKEDIISQIQYNKETIESLKKENEFLQNIIKIKQEKE